ncbi:DMT family transporter [Paenibacillus sp. FSL W8-0186]|uniref:Multidrug transporter n=1 Tax=Paenibacillus woosongensis TaxID=307580 RepID=A0ABQ4MRL7_9BACL|nr:DMT family transporter [Paenibacillus woosongensis]GIP58568.1 multidrug transporter [Paenibacillus woosongensis]
MSGRQRTGGAYEIFFILGIIAISFSAIFIRWSNAEASVVAMYRLLITNLILMPFAWRHRHEMLRLKPKQWGLLAASGLLLGLHFLLWMNSLRYTSVASSTVILTLQPVLVMLGSIWLFKERINRMMLLGMGIAVVGSILIGSGDFRLSGSALYGDILSLLGTLAISVNMLVGQHLRKDLAALPYNFWMFFMAACSLGCYNLAMGYPFTGYPMKEWGIFFLLSVVSTLFGHYLFNWLLKYMNATTVSMAILGEPICASLLALVLLGEMLTGLQLFSGLIIIAGVWVFMRHRQAR